MLLVRASNSTNDGAWSGEVLSVIRADDGGLQLYSGAHLGTDPSANEYFSRPLVTT